MSEENTRRWPCVCVDVETLSTGPQARVLEIGAVCFDPATGEMGPAFEAECHDPAGVVDEDTRRWWEARVAEGRRMPGMNAEEPSAAEVMEEFRVWLADLTDVEKVEMWAWGSDFDFPILKDVTLEGGWKAVPWRYGNQRCARTLCAEVGVKRVGEIRHEALPDAMQEARAVMAALSLVKGRLEVWGKLFLN
jgi:exodeoxyribonuclease VIII